jgi:hypothetical protein
VLANPERRRGLLARSRRPSRRRRGPGSGCDDHGRNDCDGLFVIVVIVIVDLDNRADLDLDLISVVVVIDDLDHLGRRGICFVRIGVDAGVGGFFGHSGSYVTDR